MSDSTIKSFISDNSNLFIKVSNSVAKIRSIDDVNYTILNYDKIISEMHEFVEGFMSYHEKGGTEYSDKILQTTISFCDKMFTKLEYRKQITLEEFKDINHSFLVKTKELKTLLDGCDKSLEADNDYELRQMLNLINKQYSKVSGIMKDDMSIYMWLSTQGCTIPALRATLAPDLINAFQNNATPVMHKM